MNAYFSYLKSRSKLSLFYRNFVLFPRIKHFTKRKNLDIGCGIGDYLKYDKNSIGVDINLDCVNYCKSLNLDCYQMKEDELPFDSNIFDSILLDNVLEHIENPKLILKEINRVLCPNGNFIIGVPCEKGYEHDNDHKQFYDIKKLKKLLIKEYSLKYYFYTPPFSYAFRKYFKQVALYAIFIKK